MGGGTDTYSIALNVENATAAISRVTVAVTRATGSNYCYGVQAIGSGSTTMDRLTATASGAGCNVGLATHFVNFTGNVGISNSNLIGGDTSTWSGALELEGGFTTGTVTVRQSTLSSAASGTTAGAIMQYSGGSTVKVYDSIITGASRAIFMNSGSLLRVATSQVSGAVYRGGGVTELTCIYVFNPSFGALNATCQ